MGRAGLNRKTALATATLTLSAEAADLDVLSRFGGSAFSLNHHRGFTHSFLGVPLFAAEVVAFVYGVWRLRGRKTRNPNLPARWGLLFAYACLAGFSHILLDYTNSYGIRPFWPFSERWISWDIVYIVEPVILVVLILGLTVPGLFSLINQEIGARRKDNSPPGRVAASVALIAVFACWGLRDYEHRRAIAALFVSHQSIQVVRGCGNARFLCPGGCRFSRDRGRSRSPDADSLQAGGDCRHAGCQTDVPRPCVFKLGTIPGHGCGGACGRRLRRPVSRSAIPVSRSRHDPHTRSECNSHARSPGYQRTIRHARRGEQTAEMMERALLPHDLPEPELFRRKEYGASNAVMPA